MTPREIYFIISALGFGIYIALALSTTFRHGWHFPYKWYTIVMLYLSACCIVAMPVFDFIYDPESNRGTYIAIDIASNLLAPLLLTSFVLLANPTRRFSFRILFLLWIPFVLYLLVYHFVTDIQFMLYIAYAYLVGTVIVWGRRILFRVREYSQEFKSDTKANAGVDILWMRAWVWVVALLTVAKFSLLTFTVTSANDDYKPQLISMMAVYLPLIIIYEFQYSRRRYFENFDPLSISVASEGESAFSSKKKADTEVDDTHQWQPRNGADRIQRPSKLAPNAILPNLTAAHVTQGTSTLDEDDPQVAFAHIDAELKRMEEEGQFFLDKDLSATTLAKLLGVSRPTLSAYFHDHGMSFFDYVERLRIAAAADLLLAYPEAGLDLIAHRSGFSSRSNFHRSFLNIYHCSPDDYRKNQK